MRLTEVAREAGAPASYLVDAAADIEPGWFDGVETVGLTSGASVPEVLVEGVLAYLADNGFADVEEYTEVKESLLFALPPELRRSMKAKASGAVP